MAYVGQQADATLAELNKAGLAYSGRPVVQTCSCDAIDANQLCHKKSMYATKRESERVTAARAAHLKTVYTRPDGARFHLLDETALHLNYTRRYARAPGGARVGGTIPLNQGRSLTLIGALPVQGLGAVQVLNGALLTALCLVYNPMPSPNVTAGRCAGVL